VRGREYGQCGGSDQPDLIFCFFFIKKKEEGLRGLSGASQARKASPSDIKRALPIM
jgi:hypothetical protein